MDEITIGFQSGAGSNNSQGYFLNIIRMAPEWRESPIGCRFNKLWYSRASHGVTVYKTSDSEPDRSANWNKIKFGFILIDCYFSIFDIQRFFWHLFEIASFMHVLKWNWVSPLEWTKLIWKMLWKDPRLMVDELTCDFVVQLWNEKHCYIFFIQIGLFLRKKNNFIKSRTRQRNLLVRYQSGSHAISILILSFFSYFQTVSF